MEKQQNKHEDMAPSEEDKRAKINNTLKELEETIDNTRRLCNAEAKLQKVIYNPDQLLKQMPETESLLATLKEIIEELCRKNVDDSNNIQLKDKDKDLNSNEDSSCDATAKIQENTNHIMGKEDTIMEKNDTKDLSLCNAEAKLQGNDKDKGEDINTHQENDEEYNNNLHDNTNNYIEYLEQENVDLKTQYEHLKKKALLREKELLSRIQEYAAVHKRAGSSEVSIGQKVENNKLIKPTINDTEEPDPTSVPPKIHQSLKKSTSEDKELSKIKSPHKPIAVDKMIMELAERRCMEVSHGSELHAPPPEKIMQITREKRQRLHDVRRDIDNGLDIPKFVISRHNHYHHYHYHHVNNA